LYSWAAVEKANAAAAGLKTAKQRAAETEGSVEKQTGGNTAGDERQKG
jgi:hypothetical protein